MPIYLGHLVSDAVIQKLLPTRFHPLTSTPTRTHSPSSAYFLFIYNCPSHLVPHCVLSTHFRQYSCLTLCTLACLVITLWTRSELNTLLPEYLFLSLQARWMVPQACLDTFSRDFFGSALEFIVIAAKKQATDF